MHNARQRRHLRLLCLTGILSLGALLTASCKEESANAPKGPDKRWDNFQKGNAKDLETAQSAFERRQAQLSEKRKKGTEGSASPAPSASPSATAPSPSPSASPSPAKTQ